MTKIVLRTKLSHPAHALHTCIPHIAHPAADDPAAVIVEASKREAS